MLNLSKFMLKRMLPDREKVRFVLKRMFPPQEPKLTFLRIKNSISAYLAWKYGIKLSIKPIILQIEPVKGCNLNCIMCGSGQFKLQKLPFDDFKRIIDNLPEAMFLILNYGGEPFLSKDTLRMIKYAQRRAIVIIFSNFTVLPEPEDIINSGLFEINASIDSFDNQKYNFIRKGGDLSLLIDKIDKIRIYIERLGGVKEGEWKNLKPEELYKEAIKNQIIRDKKDYGNGKQNTLEIVVKNLKNLVDTRRKLKKKLPIISINSVFAKETKEDAEDIIKNAIKLGVDRVKFQRLAFDVPGIFHTPGESDFIYLKELKKKYKNQIEISLVNFEFGGDYPKGYCYFAYFMSTVDVNKNILPCCMPYQYNMDTNDLSFGVASSAHNIKTSIENRQKFINSFRISPLNFCLRCPLYLRK